MYGGGGFDAGASQFNGAGFMPSQGNAGGGAASGKKNFENKSQTLRAVTIKQLADASAQRVDDSLAIDGRDVSNITLVGKVLSTNESGLTYGLEIDDGTGKAAVKIWISDDDSELDKQRRAEWRAGSYVRVHGHISNFGKNQEVIAFNIRPVTDHNEITYHFLQCIFQHAHLVKGAPGGGAVKQEQGGYGAPAAAAPAAGGYGGAPAAGGYNPNGGLSAVQADVMNFFNAPDAQGDAGISLDDVLARAGGRYSMVQIREAVDALQNEGHLYSTIDENHFKSCNA
ncbi:replication A 32 kDa subunit A-like [Chlorella sorokiniana]|jgi:replication factor A2|uniref:Replication A 32 kDa subunit A-like n=1 Tax=Chlorella sorokiniana TaxID=3076 RepID=A0A2P6TQ77_CHLSO|nr:replication A 32 kDa subunit A-like [Chlorella sorokiniana]|eukprot:PRW56187.1 replication A 32 kDa subunit A-like [Chlorella sorokiniana]